MKATTEIPQLEKQVGQKATINVGYLVRNNMPNRLMLLLDKLLVRKQTLIETINSPLKNISRLLIPGMAASVILRSIC
jgi:hypothetical protein